MSNINFDINENFPVAGEDNDTQVFRDNFDTIKKSLRAAKEELEDLQNPTTGSARLDKDNDFNLNIIQGAVFQNNREKVVPRQFINLNIISSAIPVDYESGSYHIFEFEGNDTAVELDIIKLPGDPALTFTVDNTLGRLTLELYSVGEKTVTFKTNSGTVIKKDPSFPSTLTVDSTTDPVVIEVWRYNQSTIYMKYIGVFS